MSLKLSDARVYEPVPSTRALTQLIWSPQDKLISRKCGTDPSTFQDRGLTEMVIRNSLRRASFPDKIQRPTAALHRGHVSMLTRVKFVRCHHLSGLVYVLRCTILRNYLAYLGPGPMVSWLPFLERCDCFVASFLRMVRLFRGNIVRTFLVYVL